MYTGPSLKWRKWAYRICDICWFKLFCHIIEQVQRIFFSEICGTQKHGWRFYLELDQNFEKRI